MTVNKAQFGLEPPPRAQPKPLKDRFGDRFDDKALGQMGSVTDIANLLGVGSTAVSNWIARHDDFPLPKSVVGTSGSRQTGIWDLTEVQDWYHKRGED